MLRLVGKSHWTGVGWTRAAEPKGTGSVVLPQLPPCFPEYVRRPSLDAEIEATFPSAKQVFFEEVKLGMEIPPLVRNLSHDHFEIGRASCRERV